MKQYCCFFISLFFVMVFSSCEPQNSASDSLLVCYLYNETADSIYMYGEMANQDITLMRTMASDELMFLTNWRSAQGYGFPYLDLPSFWGYNNVKKFFLTRSRLEDNVERYYCTDSLHEGAINSLSSYRMVSPSSELGTRIMENINVDDLCRKYSVDNCYLEVFMITDDFLNSIK